jgi:ADP-heptose:LPS heptosyltransferase
MGASPNHPRASIAGKFVLGLLHLRRSLVRLIKHLLYRRFRPCQSLETVLVFRSGRLGDFLNALPALNLLRSRLPTARIILATTASSLPAMQSITRSYADLNSLPWLEFVTPSLVDRAVTFTVNGRDKGLAAMRRTIGEEHPDAIFVLPYMGEPLGGKLRKLLFFKLAGFNGPIFGFDGLASRGSLQRSQYQLGLYEHEVSGPVRAVSECGAIGAVAESEIIQDLSIPDHAMTWAQKVMEGSGFKENILVAVSPGATFIHKVWPADRYVELCRALLERYDCRFMVVGIDADRQLGDTLKEALGTRCLDMTGKTSVTQLAALLGRCHLFVGNDSGPAHLASAAGCPCVTVTSALDFPGIWEPWNSRKRVARVRIDCEFCLSLISCPLKTNDCIRSVDAHEVLRMCCQVLGSAMQGRPDPENSADLCPNCSSC